MTILIREARISDRLEFSDDETPFVKTEDYRFDNTGQVLVTLNVDGEFSRVSINPGSTGQVQLIRAAISQLEQVAVRLEEIGAADQMGRCMERGEWGRCLDPSGHDGEHRSMTHEQFESQLAARSAARKMRRVS